VDTFVKSLTDFKDHYGVIWFYVAGFITLIGTAWRLRNVFKDKPSLQIVANMVTENKDDLHGLLTIEITNLGKRKAVIKQIIIPLQSASDEMSSTLNIGKKVVEIKEHGGIYTWQQVLRQRVNFQSYQEGADSFAYGEVYSTLGKMQRFDFKLLTDAEWKLIEQSQSSRTILAIGPTVIMDYKKGFDNFESAEIKLNLYPRRLSVLQATKRFLDDAISNRTVTHQSLQTFDRETGEAKNIFQNDIQDLLKSIRENGNHLWVIAQKLSGPDYDGTRHKYVERKSQILNSFIDLLQGLDDRFSRYLKITE